MNERAEAELHPEWPLPVGYFWDDCRAKLRYMLEPGPEDHLSTDDYRAEQRFFDGVSAARVALPRPPGASTKKINHGPGGENADAGGAGPVPVPVPVGGRVPVRVGGPGCSVPVAGDVISSQELKSEEEFEEKKSEVTPGGGFSTSASKYLETKKEPLRVPKRKKRQKKKFSVNGTGMVRKKEKAALAGKKKKKFMARGERGKKLIESDVCYWKETKVLLENCKWKI